MATIVETVEPKRASGAGDGTPARPSRCRILLVDDEQGVLNALRRMCMNAAIAPVLPGPEVTTFTSPADALAWLVDHPVDIVVSDFRMPGMDGATFLARVRNLRPEAGRIILSAFADMDGVVRAINDAGILRFVHKPWSDAELKNAILEVIEHRQLQDENRRLADELRAQRDMILRQQLELARLEAETPGITRVRWSDDGGVMLEY